MPGTTTPTLRNIVRATTYAQRCCIQHLWAHLRRDFLQCAAAEVRLAGWTGSWLGRIATIYRLNFRLECR